MTRGQKSRVLRLEHLAVSRSSFSLALSRRWPRPAADRYNAARNRGE